LALPTKQLSTPGPFSAIISPLTSPKSVLLIRGDLVLSLSINAFVPELEKFPILFKFQKSVKELQFPFPNFHLY
jgi:hypothetical protein